jgi:hypothetical protein
MYGTCGDWLSALDNTPSPGSWIWWPSTKVFVNNAFDCVYFIHLLENVYYLLCSNNNHFQLIKRLWHVIGYCVLPCIALCGALSMPASDMFTCLALHKRSLFAGGLGGLLCELELVGNHALVVSTNDVGVPITSLSFNASHQTLAIGSTQVRHSCFIFAKELHTRWHTVDS